MLKQGGQRLQGQCCRARLVALTFPPTPFPSRAAGEEGGEDAPVPRLNRRTWFRGRRLRESKGQGAPHLAWISGRGYVVVGCGRARSEDAPHLSPIPFLSFTGSGRAEVRVAMAILRLRLSTIPRIPRPRPPRSRAAGAGPGVRAARLAARMCDGWRNRTLAPQRSGCPGSVRSQ